jgi:1-acyl-sn-glycerol-3-phosphate acyltransferase
MASETGVAGLAARLNRLWRQAASAVSFLIFGLSAAVFGLVLVPLVRLLVRDLGRRQRVVRSGVQLGMYAFWRLMTFFGLFRYELHGTEHLSERGVLIVANHPTLIDAVLLLGIVEDAAVVAKQALAASPITGATVAAAGYVVNDDGPAMVEAAARELARPGRVLVFPESTRTPRGGPVRLQRGAANIAVRTGCRVVVVTIRVSHPLLYKGAAWYDMPMAVPHFEVRVLPPFDVGPIVAAHESIALAARELNERLQRLYDSEMVARESA